MTTNLIVAKNIIFSQPSFWWWQEHQCFATKLYNGCNSTYL